MLPPGQRVMNNTFVRNPAQMAVHQHTIFEQGGGYQVYEVEVGIIRRVCSIFSGEESLGVAF